MMIPPAVLPPLDATLRVGCRLVYQVSGPAALLLNVEPRADGPYRVLQQVLDLDGAPAETLAPDSHGNVLRRLRLRPGTCTVRHDAIVAISSRPDNAGAPPVTPETAAEIPPGLLRYVLPSRYCDSDKLADFAWQHFGGVPHGLPRMDAISAWLHRNVEYRFRSGRADISAWEVLQRGYGVCRDFAHLAVALNRTFNLPARYVTGHLPDIGVPDPEGHMDFHAYAEVFVGGRWFTTDPRFHVPRIGRITVACGLDAMDGAFLTIFGGATLAEFQVWAYQVARGTVDVGAPLDLSRRLDNSWTVRTEPAL